MDAFVLFFFVLLKGFLFSCETAEEFDDLCARLKEIEVKNPQSHVIGVGERDPDYGGVVKGPDPLAHLIFD